MSLAKTLTVVVDRFEGYGVIKRLVKRDREESRGEKEIAVEDCSSIISVQISEYMYLTK